MDTGPTDDQCARALCNSRIIALIVSNNTFKGIADLEPESQCEVRLSSLLLHYEMVLEILEHRPHTRVLPIFYEDRGVPDRFENIDKRAFCFSDQWLAKLKSQLKFHSVSQKALHLLRRHDGELARKLDNKQLKLGGVSIPSLIRGRRLKETMQAIAGLEPYEIEAMPKDRAIALLVEHVLKMLNESREEDHCPEHRDVSTRHGTGEGSSSSNAKSKRPLKSDDSGPCDIEDIQNHADGSGGAGAARVRGPQVFLGYRVHSEKDLVERLCDKLELKGINVWCDFRSLPGGELWEESFVDGLCSSDVFVPVMSKAALAPFASLTPESTCDNVLFEHQLALELKMRGQLHRIFPVLVGELRHDEELGEIYGTSLKGMACPAVLR